MKTDNGPEYNAPKNKGEKPSQRSLKPADLEALAEKIIRLLKQEARVEIERMGRSPPR